jgi:hypothetical protein
MTERLAAKYTSKKPQEIKRMVSKRVKLDDYFKYSYERLQGVPVAKTKRKIIKKDDDI